MYLTTRGDRKSISGSKVMPPHATLPRSSAFLLALLMAVPAAAFARQGTSRGVGVKARAENGETVHLYDESHALIIGVSDYTSGWRSLPGVKKDVAAVERALLAHGFTIETLMNPTGRILDQSVRDFIGRRGQAFGNRLLIYFAGHGETLETLDGRQLGYIVPADAPPPGRNAGQFKQTAVSMDMIDAYARLIESKHALFVFDSCFSGSLFENSRAAAPPPAITHRTTLPVRQFITAGTGEQEVPDRSIFREEFVQGLSGKADANRDGFITGSELGEFLVDSIANYTGRAQTPRWGKIRDPNLDKGDFVFASPKYAREPIVVSRTERVDQYGPPPQSGPVNQLCGTISILVASSRKGFRDIIAGPLSKSSSNYFTPSVLLPGAMYGVISPGSYVYYVVTTSSSVGDAASEYYKLTNRVSECLPSWEQKREETQDMNKPSKYRRVKFKERKNGVVVKVSIISTAAAPRMYYVRLYVYTPDAGQW